MSDAEADLDRADMARLVLGNDAGLGALMERHAGRLQAYLRRLVPSGADAEDLAQEAFTRVYLHRGRFDSRQSFVAWLYTIASNLARDRNRWRRRHPEAPIEESGPLGETCGPVTVLTHPSGNPGDDVLASERSEAVRAAVSALPEDLRTPLILAEYEDRSHLEIAGILGCSGKAVEMRLYRARQRLRESLARWLAA